MSSRKFPARFLRFSPQKPLKTSRNYPHYPIYFVIEPSLSGCLNCFCKFFPAQNCCKASLEGKTSYKIIIKYSIIGAYIWQKKHQFVVCHPKIPMIVKFYSKKRFLLAKYWIFLCRRINTDFNGSPGQIILQSKNAFINEVCPNYLFRITY